jgi:hypothetical protein
MITFSATLRISLWPAPPLVGAVLVGRCPVCPALAHRFLVRPALAVQTGRVAGRKLLQPPPQVVPLTAG